MNLFRRHWFDIGGILALITLVFVYSSYREMATIQVLLWLSLASLFIHQVEEYRYPGYFPGMLNSALYKSNRPDRYPLNTQTALVVNVPMGWLFYFLAAVFARDYIWLDIATMLVSFGNVVAHTLLFNLKGRTFYNPGMATALILFLPLVYWFIEIVRSAHLAGLGDWIGGIILGLALNAIGILKLIDWLADRNTTYVFEQRQLRPADRN
jgi:hypothetical protein